MFLTMSIRAARLELDRLVSPEAVPLWNTRAMTRPNSTLKLAAPGFGPGLKPLGRS
jgi:hypothetical protein